MSAEDTLKRLDKVVEVTGLNGDQIPELAKVAILPFFSMSVYEYFGADFESATGKGLYDVHAQLKDVDMASDKELLTYPGREPVSSPEIGFIDFQTTLALVDCLSKETFDTTVNQLHEHFEALMLDNTRMATPLEHTLNMVTLSYLSLLKYWTMNRGDLENHHLINIVAERMFLESGRRMQDLMVIAKPILDVFGRVFFSGSMSTDF